jgi:hypothetical protein
MNIHQVATWRTPASAYPRRKLGRSAIKTAYYKGMYPAYGTAPPNEAPVDFVHVTRRIKVTTLEIDGNVWMVDDCPHSWATLDHARHYYGHVLVAGLGLGLIVWALQNTVAVDRITVVEVEPDVINLVGPLLSTHKRLKIIRADWFRYSPRFKPDGVFFDLFVGDGHTLLPSAIRAMIELRQRFGGSIPIRIHGFPTEYLQRIASAAASVESTGFASPFRGEP